MIAKRLEMYYYLLLNALSLFFCALLTVAGAVGPNGAVAQPLDSQCHSQRISLRLVGGRVSAAPNLSETPTNPTRQGETEDVG